VRIALATGNRGKITEFRELLAPLDVDIVSQGELGVDGAAETAPTFVENALLKARHVSRESGLPALADDSGLAVAALQGAPGVHSARFAGPAATDADNNALLMARLRGCRNRAAAYYCALVFLLRADDPTPLIATARWAGTIVDEPRGAGGFGYDPYFRIDALGCTAAELAAADKNRLSHRGQATTRLLELLPDRLAEAALEPSG